MIDLPLQEAARMRHGLHLFILGCFTVAILIPYVACIIDALKKGRKRK